MIEILATGAMSTVQDAGRQGHRRLGVSVAGPLDSLACAVGNAMLGNGSELAFIEIVLFPFRARFAADGHIALTGANAQASLDDVPVLPWWTLPVRAGQVLSLRAPTEGAVAYLCTAGGIDVPSLLGSRSTDLKAGFGGLEGRVLRKGDCLARGQASVPWRGRGFGVRPPSLTEAGEGATVVRVLPAAEWETFPDEARQRFLDAAWRISPQSNRIGVRLEGLAIRPSNAVELLSHGIVPGVVQVPPSGQPIVMQCDAQTSGGYPKIATVIEADQWRVAQTRMGARLRFRAVSLDEARQAWDEWYRFIERVRQAACLAQ